MTLVFETIVCDMNWPDKRVSSFNPGTFTTASKHCYTMADDTTVILNKCDAQYPASPHAPNSYNNFVEISQNYAGM